MITAYRPGGQAMAIAADPRPESIPDDVVWLDLSAPDRAEDNLVEALTGIEVPTREDLRDIEPSSRLYSENGTTHLTASLLCHADSARPVLADVAFVLSGRHLVTVRYDNPKSFALFAAALKRMPDCRAASDMLVRLVETIVDRTAEILEQAELKGETLSEAIFAGAAGDGSVRPRKLDRLLVEIAAHQRLVGKARDSLASLARLVSYLQTVPEIQARRDNAELAHSIARDIQSLSEHAGFIASNTAFLLDATLGLINVEQNGIIKIFSIASVVFLPPTLVASLYGMNFQAMPELQWSYGYPMALALMLVSAIIPYYFFRWKGWL